MPCRKYGFKPGFKPGFKTVLRNIIYKAQNQYGNTNCRTFMTILQRLTEEIRKGHVYINKGDILFLIEEIEKYTIIDLYLFNKIIDLSLKFPLYYKNDIKLYYEIIERERIVNSQIKIIYRGFIDIHGMRNDDLYHFLKTNIHIIKKIKKYKIICGRGIHSLSRPVLKDSIINFCRCRKLKYKTDSKGGCIIINP